MSTVMQSKQRWQDGVTLWLGVWLFIAPFVMSYGALNGPASSAGPSSLNGAWR